MVWPYAIRAREITPWFQIRLPLSALSSIAWPNDKKWTQKKNRRGKEMKMKKKGEKKGFEMGNCNRIDK